MVHSDPAVTLRVYSQCEEEQSKAEMAVAGRIFGAVEDSIDVVNHQVNMTSGYTNDPEWRKRAND
jgi:hypothetical protein